MTNESVRHKDQQETEEIEYRMEGEFVRLVTEDISQITYGIAVYRKGHKLYQLKDITTDKNSLQKLVELCNRERLSVCHLNDVVEDFLGTIYGETF